MVESLGKRGCVEWIREEEVFSHITDQTIMAASQMIEGASVKPRMRIMSEVHPEGNPHSNSYPQISEQSFNLILQVSTYEEKFSKLVSQRIPEIKMFTIHHKRNGEHVGFQFKP